MTFSGVFFTVLYILKTTQLYNHLLNATSHIWNFCWSFSFITVQILCTNSWNAFATFLAQFPYNTVSHCVIQVKVPLKIRLKLIVMTSSSIHMMTSQDRICVQCVTNGLLRKEDWMITNWHTVANICTHVLSVRNVFHISVTWAHTWMFTGVNTSALNVESVSQTMES